jgi:hypothetical protein
MCSSILQDTLVRDSSVVRRHYIFLLEPSDVRALYIRKTAKVLHWMCTCSLLLDMLSIYIFNFVKCNFHKIKIFSTFICNQNLINGTYRWSNKNSLLQPARITNKVKKAMNSPWQWAKHWSLSHQQGGLGNGWYLLQWCCSNKIKIFSTFICNQNLINGTYRWSNKNSGNIFCGSNLQDIIRKCFFSNVYGQLP